MIPPGVSDLEFLLPPEQPVDDFCFRLTQELGSEMEPSTPVRQVLLDTFGWRLYHHGTCLEQVCTTQTVSLHWRRLLSTEQLRELPVSSLRFAHDLPDGPLRHQLEAVIEMRALVPQLELRGQQRHFALRNRNGKIVLRGSVDTYAIPVKQKARRLAPSRLRLYPVRGYFKPLMRTRRHLLGSLGLTPASEDIWVEALRMLGRTVPNYSSKIRVELLPTMNASEATCRILLHLLDTMEMNEGGTMDDVDSEFLHDFRVSIRRTRSALSQIKGVLPRSVLEHFSDEFAWLGTITSPLRDLDVYLLQFPNYRAALPPTASEHLAPLHDFLVAHQRAEQGALVKHLRSRRYRTLKKGWRTFLKNEFGQGTECPANGKRPVVEVARERIWKVYRKLLRDGAELGPRSPAEAFHDLRKTCKKLRYLLEFFQCLFPPGEVPKLIKAMKGLQDNLGTYQDLQVQAMALTRFGQQMKEEGTASAECLMAMGILVEDLSRRQGAVHEEFADRFASFRTKSTIRRFRRLFAPTPRKESSAP